MAEMNNMNRRAIFIGKNNNVYNKLDGISFIR